MKVTVKLQSFRLPTSVTQNLHDRFGPKCDGSFLCSPHLAVSYSSNREGSTPEDNASNLALKSTDSRNSMPPFTLALIAAGNTSHRSLNHAHDSANFVSTYYYLHISHYVTTDESCGVKTGQGFSKRNACKAHHLQQYYAMSAYVLLLLTVGSALAKGHREKSLHLDDTRKRGTHKWGTGER